MHRAAAMDIRIRWGRQKIMRTEYKREDRISSLPDELIHQILKFLPDTKSAVRTSALSKRWKLIWTTLPYLNLEWNQQGSPKNITNFTRHVLKNRNHQSAISCFKLACLPPALTLKFIDYAVSHQVQDLTVCLRDKHKTIKLSKFSSKLIHNLVLSMKVEDIVEDSDCWDLPALTNLHLSLVPVGVGDGNRVLPVRCLTCLPALRTLSLTSWDFREPSLYLSLTALTNLCLTKCKMPHNIWNLPALKTLTLDQVHFPGNMMSNTLAALVNLENLILRGMLLHNCYIRCPQLMNLEIETRCFDTIVGNFVVLAPKLVNFTAVGLFPIVFEYSKLENVYIKLGGWINHTNISEKNLKEYYQRFMIMFPALGSAKILNLQLETIKALSSISDSLVSAPSPFYNLKYVKLPHGFKEASLSSVLRNYLLGGSPTATVAATLPQNIIRHTAAASATAQNLVMEETLAAWQHKPPKPHPTDCRNDDAISKLQDLKIHIDDAKTKLQDLQTLHSEKMQ